MSQETTERIEELKQELASMRIRDAAGSKDSSLARLGAGMMIVGTVLAVVAFVLTRQTSDAASQARDQALALAAATVAIVGSIVWLRYSLAAFFKLWLARVMHHQRTGE